MVDSQDGPVQPGSYHVGRLDDVRERLSSVETALKSLASKEDVATAKFAMLATIVAMSISAVAAIATVIVAVSRVLSSP